MAQIPKNHYLFGKPQGSTFQGKTVIVTGGANGIGAAVVGLYHSEGANVVVADVLSSQPQADSLNATLSPRAVFMPTDILDWKNLTEVFSRTRERFGRIDLVVANAGLMESEDFFNFDDIDENGDLNEPRESHKVLDVNIKGTANTLRLAMHTMRKQDPDSSGSRGSIVLVASTSGYFGASGVVSYVASKHAVVGLLRASQKIANLSDVRVNAVAPYVTPTFITSGYVQKWKETGIPQNSLLDVAWAIVQTAADASMKGRCCLVAGKKMWEIEGPREQLIPMWLGEEAVNLLASGSKFFEDIGGYPLPPARRP